MDPLNSTNINSTSQPAVTPTAQPNPTPVSDPLLSDKSIPEDLDSSWSSWKCLVCNYVYEGAKVVSKCPRCGNEDPDKFD